MKKILPLIMVLAVVGFSGCKKLGQKISHIKSNTIGLNRTVTLFASNGVVIREWDGRLQIEDSGSSIRFIADGKAVTVSGTYVVQEK